MRIHWLCIRICIRLKFVFQFINVVLCNNKNDKLLFVLILWKNTVPYLMSYRRNWKMNQMLSINNWVSS